MKFMYLNVGRCYEYLADIVVRTLGAKYSTLWDDLEWFDCKGMKDFILQNCILEALDEYSVLLMNLSKLSLFPTHVFS